jgi:two-component system sensor histidine kinase KdpD
MSSMPHVIGTRCRSRSQRRPLLGVLIGIAAVLVVTVVLAPLRDDFTPAAPATLFVVPVVVAAVVGGVLVALTTAVIATAAFAFAFVPPFNSFHFHDDVLAVPVFLIVAMSVGALVAGEVSRRRLAEGANRVALLEEVDHQRAALLRSVSHDLRTPLAAVSAAASELESGVVHDEVTRHELLEVISDQAGRLDRLVANLLDLSRIEAGALRPALESVAVDELVHDRLASLNRLLAGVVVRADVPADLPAVRGDYNQLGQVVGNLIENAVRHSPSGGIITVTARLDGDQVRVSVGDEGKGVDPLEAGQIFEPFRTGRGSGSTGIGLAICKAVVEAAFCFTVPMDHG